MHGNSEKYAEIESLEKLPNVHLSIYGAHNQDVYVYRNILHTYKYIHRHAYLHKLNKNTI